MRLRRRSSPTPPRNQGGRPPGKRPRLLDVAAASAAATHRRAAVAARNAARATTADMGALLAGWARIDRTGHGTWTWRRIRRDSLEGRGALSGTPRVREFRPWHPVFAGAARVPAHGFSPPGTIPGPHASTLRQWPCRPGQLPTSVRAAVQPMYQALHSTTGRAGRWFSSHRRHAAGPLEARCGSTESIGWPGGFRRGRVRRRADPRGPRVPR